MKRLFHPQLVNDPFGDPALYIEFQFERRALLFDLGDLRSLAPRKILRVSHAFVSHTHMDHFVGFDEILRLCLGREKEIHLFGPAGFLERVEHKLSSYTWNLVGNYPTDFTFRVTEVGSRAESRTAEFHCRQGFSRSGEVEGRIEGGVLLDGEAFRVMAAVLDHGIPCLAFRLEERLHVNVWKNRLEELGLPTGPWLRELKGAVLRGDPDGAPIRVPSPEGERVFLLGELKAKILSLAPGQAIAYVADAAYHEENARQIVELARGTDLLFIEAAFLHQDADLGAAKAHLTARQAGLLARRAGVRSMVPFHFSPKYSGQGERLRREAEAAFRGGP